MVSFACGRAPETSGKACRQLKGAPGADGKMKALSLFANIGVAEAYLDSIGINVTVANEFVPTRARIYSSIYPNKKILIV